MTSQEPAYLSTPDFATLTIIKLIENFQFWFQVRPTKTNRREANLLIKYQTYNNQGMQGNLPTLINKFTNSDNCEVPKTLLRRTVMPSNKTEFSSIQLICHLSKLQKSMTDPELGILSYMLSFLMAQIVYEIFHLSST